VRRRRRPAADDAVRYAPRPAAPADARAAGAESDPLAASAPLPPALAAPLRDLYAAPPEDAPYWDALEARIVAAVRASAGTSVAGAVTGAMRAVPAAAAEWWHALARWTRPALVAAGVTLVMAGAALVQARAAADASRAHSAYRAVLGDPFDSSGLPLPAADPQLARALDAYEVEPGDTAGAADARAARVAAELLSGGLVRRRPAAFDDTARRPADPRAAERRLRREATFRAVIPAP
jgi:hypothetical protein